MKHLLSAAVVVLRCSARLSPLNAQTTLYTWTDAKGRVHITDTPPPPDAKIKDVVEHPEPTPAEARQLQDAQRQRVETRQDEQRRTEMEEALRRAREADDQARAAVQRAEEQTAAGAGLPQTLRQHALPPRRSSSTRSARKRRRQPRPRRRRSAPLTRPRPCPRRPGTRSARPSRPSPDPLQPAGGPTPVGSNAPRFKGDTHACLS